MNTISPTAWPSAPHASPSKRVAVLEQDVGGRRRSSDRVRAAASVARARSATAPAGDRQQHAGRWSIAPVEAAVLPSGSRTRGSPTSKPRFEVDEARGWPARRRDRGDRQPVQRAARGHALDQHLELELAGAARARCTARRTPSRGRSCPSAPARTAPPSRARACGAWSVATQSITPALQRLDQRPSVALGAQRRVHLEAAVERLVRGEKGKHRRNFFRLRMAA